MAVTENILLTQEDELFNIFEDSSIGETAIKEIVEKITNESDMSSVIENTMLKTTVLNIETKPVNTRIILLSIAKKLDCEDELLLIEDDIKNEEAEEVESEPKTQPIVFKLKKEVDNIEEQKNKRLNEIRQALNTLYQKSEYSLNSIMETERKKEVVAAA